MRNVVFIACIVLIAILIEHFGSAKDVPQTPRRKEVASVPEISVAKVLAKAVAREPLAVPLVLETREAIGQLSDAGVLEWTNSMRRKNGLPTLRESRSLSEESRAKIEDMIALDYFAHDSPAGVRPGHQIEGIVEAHILIGENLAKGAYRSDKHVVTAWMNSPGHRDNILKPEYKDIGVATKKVSSDGRDYWLAVQTFGTRFDECPPIDTDTSEIIEEERASLRGFRSELESLRDATVASGDSELIHEYNAMVAEYETDRAALEQLIFRFNESVTRHNSCLKKFLVKKSTKTPRLAN